MAKLELMDMDFHQLLTTVVTMDMISMAHRQGSACMMAAGMVTFLSADQIEVSDGIYSRLL